MLLQVYFRFIVHSQRTWNLRSQWLQTSFRNHSSLYPKISQFSNCRSILKHFGFFLQEWASNAKSDSWSGIPLNRSSDSEHRYEDTVWISDLEILRSYFHSCCNSGSIHTLRLESRSGRTGDSISHLTQSSSPHPVRKRTLKSLIGVVRRVNGRRLETLSQHDREKTNKDRSTDIVDDSKLWA
jgi:hypothetical protein